MLRPLQESDIERLLQLWLFLASTAHPSLPVSYWSEQGRAMRRKLRTQCGPWNRGEPVADVHWVYSRPGSAIAEGLVTVGDDHQVQTIFVSPGEQGHGVGSELMEQAKFGQVELTSVVLEENLRGRYFLQQHGFAELERTFNASAGQDEIVMRCRLT
ncbi:GNAT family N-acetyltransferase [Microbulbifer agarilyticus]|uniref:GNAT family N-acetyltransferase n=2 Tax=Microbulbifer TaxID=48073 RepID=UPI001CD58C8D|nr:GNAT family N-acetyltransferase [Microbulbifer agarilyticus]MCA0900157.1 GNAT family N-acetyltransferase [Microbulbifer agarilyticus]